VVVGKGFPPSFFEFSGKIAWFYELHCKKLLVAINQDGEA